jgi:hypothetical protein
MAVGSRGDGGVDKGGVLLPRATLNPKACRDPWKIHRGGGENYRVRGGAGRPSRFVQNRSFVGMLTGLDFNCLYQSAR